jgi:hypothetical protein
MALIVRARYYRAAAVPFQSIWSGPAGAGPGWALCPSRDLVRVRRRVTAVRGRPEIISGPGATDTYSAQKSARRNFMRKAECFPHAAGLE